MDTSKSVGGGIWSGDGGGPGYRVGDTLEVNCTSLRSHPAAKLRWYLNGEPVSCLPPFSYKGSLVWTELRIIHRNERHQLAPILPILHPSFWWTEGGKIGPSHFYEILSTL